MHCVGCCIQYIGLEEYLLSNKDIAINPDMPLDEQTDSLGYNPKYEFPRERLKFGKIIALDKTVFVCASRQVKSSDEKRPSE